MVPQFSISKWVDRPSGMDEAAGEADANASTPSSLISTTVPVTSRGATANQTVTPEMFHEFLNKGTPGSGSSITWAICPWTSRRLAKMSKSQRPSRLPLTRWPGSQCGRGRGACGTDAKAPPADGLSLHRNSEEGMTNVEPLFAPDEDVAAEHLCRVFGACEDEYPDGLIEIRHGAPDGGSMVCGTSAF